jgi:hypothetical protein
MQLFSLRRVKCKQAGFETSNNSTKLKYYMPNPFIF